MTLGTDTLEVIGIIGGLATILTSLFFAIHKRSRKKKTKVTQLSYEDAKALAYDLLKARYRGHRGYYKSYMEEFSFDLSLGTLKKALQPTNPTPNTRYVQRVLDDLKPSSYQVLPYIRENKKQVA